MRASSFRLRPLQMLSLGFAVIILIGAALLSLPVSNRDGQALSFFDSLFTATSATCVTGLIVRDTYTQFSLFGQVVILLLIQVGGLGFMTVAVLLSMVVGKRIGLKERSLLAESVSSLQIGGVVRLVRHILMGTLMIELLGAVLLSLRFIPYFGTWKGIWCGIFHSVSAFCNAGFDILGRLEPFSSLHSFAGDALVNIVIMALILLGGIGFAVWDDILLNGHRFSKYRLHTKIMLFATLILVVIPAILFYCLERNNALAGMGAGQKIIASFFQAVAPRTAGFETIAMSSMTQSSVCLVILLMFVGGGAGSTAGGVKVSTVVTVLLTASAYLRKREDVNVFKKRIADDTVRKALCTMTVYLVTAVIACFLLTLLENRPLLSLLFEAFSAIGTVGLTTGITPSLQPLSRMLIITLMFVGRVGSLSVAMAVFEKKQPVKMKMPEEKIIV